MPKLALRNPEQSADHRAALPEGLVRADRACLVTVYGDFVITQSGIGREGTAGWHHGEPEILRLPSAEDTAQAVLRGLDASWKERRRSPQIAPTDYESDLRRAVGAKSETALINGSRLVLVTRRDRWLVRGPRLFFYPARLVPREGHSIMVELEVVGTDTRPVAIVECLREALRQGEPSFDLIM